VSKAFTDEETADAPAIVPPRAPLPAGVPNYVTARGLGLLRGELAALDAEAGAAERIADDKGRARALAALAARRAALSARLASAELVPPPADDTDVVRFGATVTVAGPGGRRRWRLVGVDEADAGCAAIAFVAPLARALLGRRVGDTIRFRAPRGEEELEIVAVEYGEEAPED
jgi:transcription elongation factor GreB